jgi:hypothetical protein
MEVFTKASKPIWRFNLLRSNPTMENPANFKESLPLLASAIIWFFSMLKS